ncbi:MAG: aspartate--tRNA ligase [Oscillospiraceae bacterium]|nr:aspartate--tRNA ligase [Oscillospiraceae bacterium]
MMQSRTHTCGELRLEHVGQKVQLAGWMENVREVGGNLAFVVVRDFYGTTQLVIEDAALLKQVKGINKESTICAVGTVRERASKNPNLPTGEIEVVPETISVLGKCRYNELPFEINRSRDADETQRLKYRYLDLRNPAVKQNIILRCKVIAALRKAMLEHDFLEITTPILTASSPEGARDYLVPARKHPGKFYALPQAPQQFKQLLMTSGFDRYFQIAPCFRDEDARGDRSPGEFYQLDMEMAFATQEDVFSVLEDVLPPIFAEYGKYDIASEPPFRRIPYLESMETYGCDKPDLRIDLTAKDITDLVSETEFSAFRDGNTVKAIPVSGCSLTRKQIDKLCADVEVQAGAKPYWFRMDDNGALVGGVAKFLEPLKEKLTEELGLKPGTLVGVTSGKSGQAQKTAGVFIKTFGPAVEGHMDRERYEFCWIVDFPMYEIGEESGELEFCHNPFSMPAGGLDVLLKAERGEIDPLTITADQYDLVCNGVELSSGAVRNHDPEIMIKAFELVRLGEEDVKRKFPAMYNAFCYGAPPHAGIAPGVDRMVMLLAGEDSIREIIPFPMNKSAQDVMMGAPSTVEQKQLDELHIAVTLTEDE